MNVLQLLRPAHGTFLGFARSRGVPSSVARQLESAAGVVCPQQPVRVLELRELFERAAMRAVAGKGGNLDLSFRVVDQLANALERLGLARSSDVPDPFRRVWVRSASGDRRPAVVLACAEGELAVLCPPSRGRLPEPGEVLRLIYRGFSSTAEYNLILDDPVRLPKGTILNLVRLEGRGSIGRAHERYPVYLQASLRRLGSAQLAQDEQDEIGPCEVLDISSSGVRVECAASIDVGQEVWIETSLPECADSFAAGAVVRWARAGSGAQRSHGLLFTEFAGPGREQLDSYLRLLGSS